MGKTNKYVYILKLLYIKLGQPYYFYVGIICLYPIIIQ